MIPLLQGEEARTWLHRKRSDWEWARSSASQAAIEKSVTDILNEVRKGGDRALHHICARLRDLEPRIIPGDSPLIAEAISRIPAPARETIDFAAKNIRRFAESIMRSAAQPVRVDYGEYEAGVDWVPVRRAACYVPGGRFPLASTALMTTITAQVAGVKEIALFSPELRPEIVYAGSLAGVQEFHELGGAQAVAAATYGTDAVQAVDLIAGPGNAYVTEAKRQVQGLVGIDMLAGPSEVAVIADASGNSSWVCLDLLSQAEHDPDASAYLLTPSLELAELVAQQLPDAITSVGSPMYVHESLSKSAILVLESMEECVEAANMVAPEHLVIHVADPERLRPQLRNYGALFLGYNTTVPYGDYAAGPNHTLPTNRTARFCGGLTPMTFLRPQSWLAVKQPAEQLSRRTSEFARIEGLPAHAAAAEARIPAKRHVKP